jgi:phosphoglycerate dehydrogenase-like enzyme
VAVLPLKIVLQYAAGPMFAERLEDLASEGLSVSLCPASDPSRFREAMASAEVIWHLLDPITDATMAGAPSLRLIQKIGVGVNTIDLDAARRRKVAVCNMPGTNSQAVAEMTLLLMLGALRRIAHLDAATRAGHGWALPTALQDSYGELHGRTVGLVGYGVVPRCLAPMLAAIGARVLFCSRSRKPDAIGECRSLPALLAESDIVSLHLPLTPETSMIIDATAIASMKPGATLVNTARGGLVDETALVTALRSGRLGAAGLDVFETEPPGVGNSLLDLDNVVVTPHLAWLTRETWERSLTVAVENCRRLEEGEDLLHRVV